MTTSSYMSGRRKYQRPQAMLWAENPGIISIDGYRIPDGLEVNVSDEIENAADISDRNQFLILSDDNRDSLDFKINRIEQRERMINGRMRSYHIADKVSISTQWTMLPSRSYALRPNFNSTTGKADLNTSGSRTPGSDNSFVILPNNTVSSQQYTSDGGAGGIEILDWYENHKGPFWVYLAYDKRSNFGSDNASYLNLNKYNEVIEMYISDFSYSVQKRGGSNYDFWNISIELEEV